MTGVTRFARRVPFRREAFGRPDPGLNVEGQPKAVRISPPKRHIFANRGEKI